jgi:hypothetical protein
VVAPTSNLSTCSSSKRLTALTLIGSVVGHVTLVYRACLPHVAEAVVERDQPREIRKIDRRPVLDYRWSHDPGVLFSRSQQRESKVRAYENIV